jgi:hypothetical protein
MRRSPGWGQRQHGWNALAPAPNFELMRNGRSSRRAAALPFFLGSPSTTGPDWEPGGKTLAASPSAVILPLLINPAGNARCFWHSRHGRTTLDKFLLAHHPSAPSPWRDVSDRGRAYSAARADTDRAEAPSTQAKYAPKSGIARKACTQQMPF